MSYCIINILMSFIDSFVYIKNIILVLLLLSIITLTNIIASGLILFIQDLLGMNPRNYTYENYLVKFLTIFFWVTCIFIVFCTVSFLIQIA